MYKYAWHSEEKFILKKVKKGLSSLFYKPLITPNYVVSNNKTSSNISRWEYPEGYSFNDLRS